MIDVDKRVNLARRVEGKIVILAYLRGREQPILAMPPRAFVVHMLVQFLAFPLSTRRRATEVTSQKVRTASVGSGREPNTEVLNDLVRLFVISLVAGNNVATKKAGVTNLEIVIDPDETLSWEQRGFLHPEFLDQLGFHAVRGRPDAAAEATLH